jgi:hypothetical protein
VSRPCSSLRGRDEAARLVQHQHEPLRRRLPAIDIDAVEALPHRKFAVADDAPVDAHAPVADPARRLRARCEPQLGNHARDAVARRRRGTGTGLFPHRCSMSQRIALGYPAAPTPVLVESACPVATDP